LMGEKRMGTGKPTGDNRGGKKIVLFGEKGRKMEWGKGKTCQVGTEKTKMKTEGPKGSSSPANGP